MLFHRVTVAYGDCTVLTSLVIDGNAERCSDCILTTVTFTDTVFFVVLDVVVELEQVFNFMGQFRQTILFHQRKNSGLYRSQCSRNAQHGTCLAIFQLFLFVGGRKNLQYHTVYADRGLDDIRYVAFAGFGIVILNLFT